MITLLVDVSFAERQLNKTHMKQCMGVLVLHFLLFSPGSSPLRTRTFWLPGVTSHQAHSLSPLEGSYHAPCMGAKGEIRSLLPLRWSPSQLLIFLFRKQTGSRALRKCPGKTEAPKQETGNTESPQEMTGLAAGNRNRLGVMGANFSSSTCLHQGDRGQEISLLHGCCQENACSAHE